MAPQRGRMSFLLLLLLAHGFSAVLMLPTSSMTPTIDPVSQGFPPPPPGFRDMAKKLMMQCQGMGFQVPTWMMMMMGNVSNTSRTPEDGMVNPLPLFQSLASSLPPLGSALVHSAANHTVDSPDEWNVTEKMRNCSSLPALIKLIRNSSEGPQCFFRALVAPLSWASLTLSGGNNLDPEDYGRLVWAATPLLQNMAPPQMALPPSVQRPQLEVMMRMLREVFGSLSDDQQNQIKEWARERIVENYYNCSLTAGAPTQKSDMGKPGKPVLPPRCSSKLMWVNMDVMKMLGPFLTRLPVDDIKTILNNQLCSFFPTPDFSSSFRGVARMNPSVGRKILDMVKECFKVGADFSQNVDRLGSLACFYDDAPALNSSLSKKLLSQLSNCSNSDADKLKSRLVKEVMSSSGSSPSPQLLHDLGEGVTALSPSSLFLFPNAALQQTLASLGPTAQWSVSQAKTLVKKLLQGKEVVSNEELMSLGSAVRGVSSKVLRKVKAQGLLGSADLQRMSQGMTKLQKMALLEGLQGGANASELVQKAPASLLSSLSLTTLDRANFTTLDQLDGKNWTRAQSAFLVRRIMGKMIKAADLRKLGSAIQGVACDMIDKTSDVDVMDMAMALTEAPQWLTKAQVCCAARRLFASLQKVRADYFKNITEVELTQIPTMLLVQLPAPMVEGLPPSVCAGFLQKMAQANLSSLPLRSPSRPALVSRALSCLLNGWNMSDLRSEEVLSLGSLLCDIPPARLSLLNPDSLNSTLLALASCAQIPPPHRRALVQLVNQTFGDPSSWSMDTTVALSPLLLLDDSTITSLRYKPWLKAVLSDMMDNLPRPQSPPPPPEYSSAPDLSALQWKLFSLATAPEAVTHTAAPARRKRAVASPAEPVPLAPNIESLGLANVYWSPNQLSMMSNDTFIVTAETLGAVPNYSAEQLSVLRQKVIQTWGPAAGLNESQVAQLACICQGFNLTELSSLPISSLDTLDALAPCSWNQPQRESVWKVFIGRYSMTVGQLKAVELVGLNQFICGLSPNEINLTTADAFSEALGPIGNMQCPLVVTERMKYRAVALFGQASSWTQAQVNTLGNIIAGLSSAELSSLNPSVLPFLSRTSIPLIPAERLATLPASQLEALGPDNSAMVTAAQRKMLGVEQQAALDRALGVVSPRTETVTQSPPNILPQKSGASTLGTLGLGVYLQPCLVLLLILIL